MLCCWTRCIAGNLHQLDECEIQFVAEVPVFSKRKTVDTSCLEKTLPKINNKFDPVESMLPKKDTFLRGAKIENDFEAVSDEIVNVSTLKLCSQL